MVLNRTTQIRSPNTNDNRARATPRHEPSLQREPTEDEIRARAYEIYRARGNEEPGHEREDWERAERELRDRRVRN